MNCKECKISTEVFNLNQHTKECDNVLLDRIQASDDENEDVTEIKYQLDNQQRLLDG